MMNQTPLTRIYNQVNKKYFSRLKIVCIVREENFPHTMQLYKGQKVYVRTLEACLPRFRDYYHHIHSYIGGKQNA